jgi:hypothetical protein
MVGMENRLQEIKQKISAPGHSLGPVLSEGEVADTRAGPGTVTDARAESVQLGAAEVQQSARNCSAALR